MSAFTFGPDNRELYGYYHAPSMPDRGNALVCQPWGIEYEYAHRSLRFLASRLARSGLHTLRFDYAGTGDSWGGTREGDLGTWVGDVERAAAELMRIGGVGSLRLIGLRLGASLAARAAERIDGVSHVVLWDPIVDGGAWIRELDDIAPASDGFDELGRYSVAPGLRGELTGLTTVMSRNGDARRLVLWTTSEAPPTPTTSTDEDGLVILPQPSPWIEDTALGAGQIPVDAISQIVRWVSG